MNSSEFNNAPKDTMLSIGDMDSFLDFISHNCIFKVTKNLMMGLFRKTDFSSKLIEKYILIHKEANRKEAEKEIKKFVRYTKDDSDEDDDENNYNYGSSNNLYIMRGDIDRIMSSVTNNILFLILQSMTTDNVLQLCWDSTYDDFVWIHRQPGDHEKKETSYKLNQKRKKLK
jgi:hypothetical protein